MIEINLALSKDAVQQRQHLAVRTIRLGRG
jgi:hypothetical protein